MTTKLCLLYYSCTYMSIVLETYGESQRESEYLSKSVSDEDHIVFEDGFF